MGKASRDKGNRGELEFKKVLIERDWNVVGSGAGDNAEDFFGVSPEGKVFAIEVKNHKAITLAKFLTQAREQAAKRKKAGWMLACRLDGFPRTFLVLTSEGMQTVWKGIQE